jgi:hypothetical protein
MSLCCSSCQGQNVQKLSLVYENGISQVSGKADSVGVGYGNGFSLGMGTSKIRGTQQTELSKRASPPLKKGIIRNLLIYFLVFVFVPHILSAGNIVLLYLLSICCIGIAAFHTIKNLNYNKNVYPGFFDQWNKKYICLTCGSTFIPASSMSANP